MSRSDADFFKTRLHDVLAMPVLSIQGVTIDSWLDIPVAMFSSSTDPRVCPAFKIH